MRDEDIARALKADVEEILPSSGFVASVMEAVRLDAATPPPIPFPWTRALPGVAAAVLVLVSAFVVVVQLARTGIHSSAAAALPPQLVRALEIANDAGLGWIVVASLLAFVSIRFAMRVAGARG
jgi:hypothetical protein